MKIRPWAAFVLAWMLVAWGHSQKLEIHPLTEGIYVFTTYQEVGESPFPANGLYILTNAGVALIDMPWDTTQCEPLLDSIQARHHLPVRWSISTHSHSDRTGSINILKRHGVATYASQETQRICRHSGEPIPEFTFSRDTIFQWGNVRVETFFPGEGHAPDNIVIWFPQSRVLYGGCFVKSTESKVLGNLTDANIVAWPLSIRAVQDRFPHPAIVVPGHQSWENVHSLQHTLKLLHRSLRQVRRSQ